ncbi:MAG: hypothetical protein GEU82_10810 [Luteitalea sp.]|nr:hypothetical protein [Luteitalea sp.]
MPSPIGHALAGLTVSWLGGRHTISNGPRLASPLVFACIAAAVLPDLDLVFSSFHRGLTHSIGFSVLIMIVAAGVTGWVTGRILWREAVVVGAAHASHLVLDWLGADRLAPLGLQALWPFSHDYYISNWDLFLSTQRRDPLSIRAFGINARAALREMAVMGPIAAAAWMLRRRRRSRARSSGPDARRRPSGAAGDRGGTSDRPVPRATRSE